MKTLSNITTSEELNNYAELLLNNGFTIIAPEKTSTYIHFSKDGKIGYCQDDRFRGITFTSIHKACKECGTGFGMEDDRDNELMPLSVESALATINQIAPNWANNSQRNVVRKYADLNDFINGGYGFHKNDLIIEPCHA